MGQREVAKAAGRAMGVRDGGTPGAEGVWVRGCRGDLCWGPGTKGAERG